MSLRGCSKLVALAGAWALTGCRTEQTLVTPDPHLERMLEQEKRLPYQDDPALPRGMAMQQPPDGTMPVDAIADDPRVTVGVADDRWAERIPVAVDYELVVDGRKHFDTFCAPCHGVLGDGASVVAAKMSLRRPHNLLDATVRGFPPGRIFQAIRDGYGLMPGYKVQLSVRDAWGVVAYVRALQLARGAHVADLPPEVRARLAREAP